MRTKQLVLIGLAIVLGGGLAAHLAGIVDLAPHMAGLKRAVLPAATEAGSPAPAAPNLAIRVTVTRAVRAPFTETVQVTGSLVAREEILVGPEIEGLRVLEVLVEDGQRVEKGQTLARLVPDTLEALLAQNEAALARTTAAIAQSQSNIAQAEARKVEAQKAMTRAAPLMKSGYLSESIYDQREAASKAADAALVAARDALRAAEAERAQVEAQRRELTWRRQRTDVSAPASGIISRRNARVGAMAAMGAPEPMFRLIADGEIELDAEVPQSRLPRLATGQSARVTIDGVGERSGTVRLVSAEVDRVTRLGRVRVLIGTDPALRIGSYARAVVETTRGIGVAVPRAAVMFGGDGPTVQVVEGETVVTRRVTIGREQAAAIEIVAGLVEGDLVVAKAGTFLRNGDRVRPVVAEPATASGS